MAARYVDHGGRRIGGGDVKPLGLQDRRMGARPTAPIQHFGVCGQVIAEPLKRRIGFRGRKGFRIVFDLCIIDRDGFFIRRHDTPSRKLSADQPSSIRPPAAIHLAWRSFDARQFNHTNRLLPGPAVQQIESAVCVAKDVRVPQFVHRSHRHTGL